MSPVYPTGWPEVECRLLASKLFDNLVAKVDGIFVKANDAARIFRLVACIDFTVLGSVF